MRPKKNRERKTKSRSPRILTRERLEFLALRYVTRYASTRGMLNRVLQRHIDKAAYAFTDFSSQEAMQWKGDILNRYEEKNWINDGDVAKCFIEQAQHAGLSKQRMQQKLLHKGVEKNVIQQTMLEAREANCFDDMDLKSARIFAKKKGLGMYRKDIQANPEKELARMCRAGFSYETSRKALQVTVDEED